MLVRVQVRLLCPSEADAQLVRDAVAQAIASKPRRVTHGAVAAGRRSGVSTWFVTCDVSFRVRADADAIFQDTQAKWTAGGLRTRILIGSTATLHVCAHADGEPPPWQNCRDIEYQFAKKA